MQQRSSQFLTVGSARIHAVCEGEGPLVILVHGFPESWYSWRHQLSALAEAGYQAVAIDLRGYGRSSKFLDSEYYLIKRPGCILKSSVALWGLQFLSLGAG